MSILNLVREDLRDLRPYAAAEQVAETIRLNANEAPFQNGADSFRRPLNRYPEIRPVGLRDALATHYGVAPDRLLVTRGSSEAIDLLLRSFCRAGRDNVVTVTPTFSMYRHYARVQDAQLREVPLDRETGFAVRAEPLLAACGDATRLVFLCSPNNPTGTELARSALAGILEALANRAAVVVDEAYVEFSASPGALDLLDTHDNLVVLRTLSKAHGFAGARCGAVIGPPELIGILDAVQAPYALPTPVVECVEGALTGARLAASRKQIALIVAERERLAAALAELPVVERLFPSAANFLLVQVTDAALLLEQTRTDGILVRHFGGELSDCVRITVGTSDENDRLLESLDRLPELRLSRAER